MNYQWLACVISTVLLSLLYMGAFPPNVVALGGTCDAATPCECGDRVVSDKQLSESDPVTSSICPGTGLILNDGLKLDLDGHTILGSGSGTGINMELSSFGTEIRGGTVSGFATGIEGLRLRRGHI